MVWDVNVSVKFCDNKLLQGTAGRTFTSKQKDSELVGRISGEESRVKQSKMIIDKCPHLQDWTLLVPGLWTVPMLTRFRSWLKTSSERFIS